MPTLKDIKGTIDEGDSLKQVAQFYSEIASLHLRQIRATIEKNRAFLEEIAEVFQTLKLIAAKRKIQLQRENKGTLSILITSNNRFYGDIDSRLCHFFAANTTKLKTDRLVIGRFGNDFLKELNYFSKFETIIFDKDIPQPNELRKASFQMSDYNQILVFYPQLKNVFTQKSTVVDITKSAVLSQSEGSENKIDFIFEPEIPLMLKFFDSSIVELLFEQTILESELARTAARLTSMDKADTNAQSFIKKQLNLLAQTNRSIKNTRLLNTISAIQSLENAQN